MTKEQTVAVNCQLPEYLDIEGQPGRIQQVVMNLIQNALDALENTENATLSIILEHDDNYVNVVIRDNGNGIKPEILPHIFEPFVTTKNSGKATGLGLSLSYRFISDHGGMLLAKNHEEGGAEFTLRLPISHHGENS